MTLLPISEAVAAIKKLLRRTPGLATANEIAGLISRASGNTKIGMALSREELEWKALIDAKLSAIAGAKKELSELEELARPYMVDVGEMEISARNATLPDSKQTQSISFPSWSFGYSQEPEKFAALDEARLLAWAEKHCPEAVVTTKSVSQKVLVALKAEQIRKMTSGQLAAAGIGYLAAVPAGRKTVKYSA